MSKRAGLIFVPVAGHAKGGQDILTIQEILSPHVELDIYQTTPNVGSEHLAQRLREKPVDLVIAAGGDGTISEVANALVGSDIPMGILPQGTANVFARLLHIPTNLEAACETILTGRDRWVDIATANGTPMISSVGIGFEADAVARLTPDIKHQWGMSAYIITQLQELWNGLAPFELEITTDDQTLTGQASAVTVANAVSAISILAQGTPQTIPDDGLLDVTIVNPDNALAAIACGMKLLWAGMQRTAMEHPAVTQFRTAHLRVVANPPQQVIVDGDLMGTTPVDIVCHPSALRVRVPAD